MNTEEKVIRFLISSEEKENGWPASIDGIFIWKWTKFKIVIPSWLIPPAKKTRFSSYGRKSYEDSVRRQFGFSLYLTDEASLHYYWGIQDDTDNMLDKTQYKSAVWFLPWATRRHVRHNLFTPDGKFFADLTDLHWDDQSQKEQECPKLHFKIRDYDGTEINATGSLEEQEWRMGTGLFKWVEIFYKPTIGRYLDIRYDDEVGPTKGSFKGGTIGHGIDLRNDETIYEALIHYYSKESLVFRAGYIPTLIEIGEIK